MCLRMFPSKKHGRKDATIFEDVLLSAQARSNRRPVALQATALPLSYKRSEVQTGKAVSLLNHGIIDFAILRRVDVY
jgi:hypothetical protein